MVVIHHPSGHDLGADHSVAAPAGVPDGVARSEPWFRRKQYGWGRVPTTWQGWVVLTAYLIIVLAPPLLAGTTRAVLSLVAVVAMPILVTIATRKGEPPRWQWGGRSP